MSFADITTIIGSLGFPIAACVACFWFINKTLTEIIKALDNNTTVMQELIKNIKGEWLHGYS